MASGPPGDGGPSRVLLLVEDDPDYAMLLNELLAPHLASAGFTMHVEDCCHGATRYLDGACPDVVVSDYNLPVKTGVEVLEIVRARCPGARRLILTGLPDDLADVPRGRHEVAEAVWDKSWPIQDLLDRLTKVLSEVSSGAPVAA